MMAQAFRRSVAYLSDNSSGMLRTPKAVGVAHGPRLWPAKHPTQIGALNMAIRAQCKTQETADKLITSRKPSWKYQARQPQANQCLSLHNWINGICSRCGAKKSNVLMVARAG